MGFRKWKPNKTQKEAYKRKLKEKGALSIKTSNFAIRKGCQIQWFSMSRGCVLKGKVVNSSYGKKTNQHTFTIDTGEEKVMVKGRNLYPNIIEHIRGVESLLI